MIRVVELFSGIGAQASALERLGIDHDVVAICEIDKHAIKSYTALHGETPNLGDITKVERLPDCDLLTYSFPCQDLSMAGTRKGMAKGTDTRSGLLWEVERLLLDMSERERLPEVLLMENVDAILFDANIRHFRTWITALTEMGYTSSYKVLNSTEFDVPQNRKRCFMVSILGDRSFVFPEPVAKTRKLVDLLENDVDEKYYVTEEILKTLVDAPKNSFRAKLKPMYPETDNAYPLICTHGWRYSDTHTYDSAKCVTIGHIDAPYDMGKRVYSANGTSPAINTVITTVPKVAVYPCMNPDFKVMKQGGPRFRQDGEPSQTLTAMTRHGIAIAQNTEKGYIEGYAGDGIDLIAPTAKNRRGRCQPDQSHTLQTGDGAGVIVGDDEGLRIRRLTPRECWRLQDFTDEQFDLASKVVSEAQLYKQAGNSITVRVLMAIFEMLYIKKQTIRTPTLYAYAEAS